MIPYLREAVFVAQFGAAVLAVMLWRRERSHRPVAIFLVAMTLVSWVRAGLKSWVVLPAIVAAGGDPATGKLGAPLTGWPLAAGLVEAVGLFLAWPAAVATLALVVFGNQKGGNGDGTESKGARGEVDRGGFHVRDRQGQQDRVQRGGDPGGAGAEDPRHDPRSRREQSSSRAFWGLRSRWTMLLPALVWVAVVVWLGVTYPESRPLHPHVFAAAQLTAALVGFSAVVRWWWGSQKFNTTSTCVLLILVLDALTLAGPYARGIFTTWPSALVIYLPMYLFLALIQGGSLWTRTT